MPPPTITIPWEFYDKEIVHCEKISIPTWTKVIGGGGEVFQKPKCFKAKSGAYLKFPGDDKGGLNCKNLPLEGCGYSIFCSIFCFQYFLEQYYNCFMSF